MDFKHTIGHEKQKQMFERAMQGDRLGHAYAFAGPEAIGKTTFALDLAAALGAHPVLDVVLFDSDESLSVAEARTLQSRLSLTPAGERKVAIITRAEAMTTAVANSLLKIMEEPPARSMIILVASNYYALLPTVASRVQRINFAQTSEGEVASALAEFALTEAESAEIAGLAVGRIGLAKRLLQDGELRDFFRKAGGYWAAAAGDLRTRLLTAQEIAGLPDNQIRQFLQIAMRQSVAQVSATGRRLRKLLAAWEGLGENLNTKLLLDNLFI